MCYLVEAITPGFLMLRSKQKKGDLKNKLKEVEEIKKKSTEVYKQKSFVL